jgi:hypothetical protein
MMYYEMDDALVLWGRRAGCFDFCALFCGTSRRGVLLLQKTRWSRERGCVWIRKAESAGAPKKHVTIEPSGDTEDEVQ